MTGSTAHSNDRPVSWFKSLQRYVQETDVSSLNFRSTNLKFEEASSILEFLADSQVSELDLSDNNFRNRMEPLSRLLIQTKVKKLNVCSYDLEHDDVLGLMKNLKETQITDLNISRNNFNLHIDHDGLFLSYLLESHLTALNLAGCVYFCHDEEALCFIQALGKTSLTHLNLEDAFCPTQHLALLALFFELKHTSITHLSLAGCCTGYCDLKRLGDSLRDSKLVELNLRKNDIRDRKVDDLFEALIGSTVTSLDLDRNEIRGDNDLGCFLKETQITRLNLSSNAIKVARMFSFPDFLNSSSVESLKLSGCELTDVIGMPLMRSLRFSKLTELDVSRNHFTEQSLVVLSEIVKDTSLTHFDFSNNYVYSYPDNYVDLGIILVAELSVGSKFKHLDVNAGFHSGVDPLIAASFLEKMIDSPVTFLSMSSFRLCENGVETIAPFLVNSQFTHLNLGGNSIRGGIVALAANLKFTAITHLNLTKNYISDEGAKVLVESLKQTRIIDLNLSHNKITSRGATFVAPFIKDSHVFNLKLNKNKIGNIGLLALAEHAQTSLITNLEVSRNPGRSSIVETVIWNNRRLVRQLVSFFKRLAPETVDNVLRFEDLASITDVHTFLEECLHFYKLVVEQSSAVSVLAREESITLSRNKITTLLLDEFPKQFTLFIASKVEADVTDHVKFLKRAEELGLHTIVEHLLLNRPVYTIDESHGILHPYVYELLNKYKHPICNLDVEPQGIKRISEYFTTFSNIEGAADVVRILRDINLSSVR